MLRELKAYYSRQQFAPGFWGIWLNPFYFARRGLYEEMARAAPKMRGRLLDVGCGVKPYRRLFCNAGEYIGLEYDTPTNRAEKLADYYYEGDTFPFSDSSFDGAICNQVLEHVFNPDNFIKEIARVLKPGGDLLLTVPFVWDEHEQPYDYARYSSFGLQHLLECHEFVILEQRKTNADARVLFQMINAYLQKILWTSNGKWNALTCAMFMAPVTMMGLLAGKILPRNPDLYLDQVVVAKNGPKSS